MCQKFSQSTFVRTRSVKKNPKGRNESMHLKKAAAAMLNGARLGLAFIAIMQFSLFGPLGGSAKADGKGNGKGDSNSTLTPIKHVIVIIGENRTFDHIFATYKPKDHQNVWNLLSEGIVNED